MNVKQGTITMPYKMTNANNAFGILCVTLPLNKHSNKRVSQQRVVVCVSNYQTQNLTNQLKSPKNAQFIGN